jgi:hypothetical protein
MAFTPPYKHAMVRRLDHYGDREGVHSERGYKTPLSPLLDEGFVIARG